MRTAVVVLLATGVFAAGAQAAPMAVRASFDTPTVQFGDVIRTHVVVLLHSASVRSGSLELVDDVAPLTPLSSTETTRTVQGGTITVAVTRTFSCLSSACVAANGDATPALPQVTATVVLRDGKTLRVAAAWPVLHVRGRVTSADLARSRPPFRADTTPPPPSYRVAPGTLGRVLDGLAAVLALGAAALGVYEGRRLARRRRGAPAADDLERALRLAHEAETRPPPDRRRALGFLARVLDARGRTLSGTASELAWAKPEPERETLATFVADVEREAPS